MASQTNYGQTELDDDKLPGGVVGKGLYIMSFFALRAFALFIYFCNVFSTIVHLSLSVSQKLFRNDFKIHQEAFYE
jgi:hypothetical protein